MTRIKIFAACLGTVMALGALVAANASAKGPAVVLKSEGHAVAKGTEAIGELVVGIAGEMGSCTETLRAGKVAANDKPKAEATFLPTGAETNCSGGVTLKNTFNVVQLKSTGPVTLKAESRLAIKGAGACLYEVKKLTATATFPGVSAYSVSGSGKLNRGASGPLCSKTATVEGEVQIFDTQTEALFETELT
jgi:hypothetical protein